MRDVARQLEQRRWRHRGLRAGTIHTAQGKEAADREAWRRQRYFDLVADRLPHDRRA